MDSDDKIVQFNPKLGKRALLLSSFGGAAGALAEKLDIDLALGKKGKLADQEDHIRLVSMLMAAKVACGEAGKDAFQNLCYGLLLGRIIPNLQAAYEGRADYDALQENLRAQGREVIQAMTEKAHELKLL